MLTFILISQMKLAPKSIFSLLAWTGACHAPVFSAGRRNGWRQFGQRNSAKKHLGWGGDYHEDENGIYDGIIYKLWGYNKNDVPNIKSILNHDTRNLGSALSRTVQNGDELHFFIQAQNGKDKFAFFTETEATYTQGQEITLKLRQRCFCAKLPAMTPF